MVRFWQQSVSQYLRVNSEDHNFILTEPPMNPPENREVTAEIMYAPLPISTAPQASVGLPQWRGWAFLPCRGGVRLCGGLAYGVIRVGKIRNWCRKGVGADDPLWNYTCL